MHIIDPPSPFDPKDHWEAHLRTVEALLEEHPNDETLKDAVADAKEHISSI